MQEVKATTLLEALWKMRNIKKKGITFIDAIEKEKFVSYHELREKASQVYLFLKGKNIEQNAEIVFQFSSLEAFIYTFWGCLIGNYRPVPIALVSNEYSSVKLLKILKKLDSPYLISDKDDIIVIMKKHLSEIQNEEMLGVDALQARTLSFNAIKFEMNHEVKLDFEHLNKDHEMSYIQFSSGSTGYPKGAIISHRNVMTNVYDSIDKFNFTEADSFMTWKPLTHDFSLVMFHILPIVLGVNQYLIPTNTYIWNPLLWFDKVNQHRISILGSPTFGIEHFNKFMKKRTPQKKWNLSCLKQIVIGAEQISDDVCQAFYIHLEAYQIPRNVFVPAYGLAEATLIVTCTNVGSAFVMHHLNRNHLSIGEKVVYDEEKNSKERVNFVELGTPLKHVSLKITNDDNETLKDLALGHIKVKGCSVSSGYYKDEVATSALFDQDGYLHTGDLGFMANGKLVMVGRVKEIVTVKGVNYMSHDIEQVIVENLGKNDLNKYAACNGINHKTNSEEVLIFVYYKNKLDKFIHLAKELKQVVYEKMGLMVDHVIPINQVPKTTSGKVRRVELANRYNKGEFELIKDEMASILSNDEIKIERAQQNVTKDLVLDYTVKWIENTVGYQISDEAAPFVELGIASVNVPIFIEAIEKEFKIDLPVSTIFDYPNVNQFVEHVFNTIQKQKNMESLEKSNDIVQKNDLKDKEPVAVIGMSCRFPNGANDPHQFWELLATGRDGITEMPRDRWDVEKYYDEDKSAPGKMYTKKGGFLDVAIDEFDAHFFNITPKEALALDPQQRLLLELTWEAFENGGLNISEYFGSNTGVYVAISGEEYSQSHRNSGDFSQIDAYSLTGTTDSTACGRISYTFGFEGPSLSVDTACSSSLTAIHLAAKALESGEIETAVIAGVNLILNPSTHVCFSKLQAISPEGSSKAFDEAADGYGRSEGAAVIVLKRMSDAQAGHDNISGLIRGTAINQDGKSNGLTAPNGVAQQKVIFKALKDANIHPINVSYMEMHGTGTPLGDPIEVHSASEVYGKERTMDDALKIGSVKSNIGHLEAAAGLASVIKVLLSFKHSMICSNLNFKNPNPHINWDALPVKVVAQNTPWISSDQPRIAGINGFGFGGSNAHIIIQEPPQKKVYEHEPNNFDDVLKISAKTKASLHQNIQQYGDFIKKNETCNLKDMIFSANTTRVDLDYRFTVVGKTREEFMNKLENYLVHHEAHDISTNLDEAHGFTKAKPQVVFMYTGQGSQYVGMGKELYENNKVFKTGFDECDRMFKPYLLKSLVDLVYTEGASEEQIEQTQYAQPLIFTIEYALSQLWESLGMTPQIVLGHSIGEYAAAVVSQIMTLSDAIKLVASRGRLMDGAPGNGSMGVVFSDLKTVNGLIESHQDQVAIAAHNAENSVVISGETALIEKILNQAEKKSIRTKKLRVSHAFHSPLMSPILKDFKSVADDVKFNKSQIKYISCMLGRYIDKSEVLDAGYWTNHIREKVDFYHALLKLQEAHHVVLVEVGSDRILTTLSKMTLQKTTVLPSMVRKRANWKQFAVNAGLLYTKGLDINWRQFSIDGHLNWNLIEWPLYPFDRKKYWRDIVFDHSEKREVDHMGAYHPVVGQKITTPHLGNGVIYQKHFTSTAPYFMKEHIIFDTAISPAAAHVSMILSAVGSSKSAWSCTLEKVEFRAPLIVNEDEERNVQLFVEELSHDFKRFNIHSKHHSEDSKWLLHCQGQIKYHEAYDNEHSEINIKEWIEKFPIKKDFNFYKQITNFGFDLGEGFKRITEIRQKGNEGICLVEPMKGLPHLESYVMYPGVIDSIFQTAMALSIEVYHQRNQDSHVVKTAIPYSLEKIVYNDRKSRKFWCYTQINVEIDFIVANTMVYNEKGENVLEIKNMMSKLTDEDKLLRELKTDYGHLYYHTQWLEKEAEKTVLDNEERIIVISDDVAMAKTIGSQFTKLGNEINIVLNDKYFNEEKGSYQISFENKENFNQLLNSITTQYDSKKYRIVYASGVNLSDEAGITVEKLEEVQNKGLRGLLYLVQTVNQIKTSGQFKICVVTKNVQQLAESKGVNIFQATQWGFSQVIKMEHPQIWGGIIDVDTSHLSSDEGTLAQTILEDGAKQVCLRMNGKRYEPRLVKNKNISLKNERLSRKIEIKEDATYLITGGTGFLGMMYAAFLINRGAKHITLMSRRSPDKKTKQAIQALIDQGVDVNIVQGDVAKEKDIEKIVREIKSRNYQLKGIVHAAGLLMDQMIMDQTWERFKQVMDAKVKGTLHLHHATQNDDLDFFIKLSSITAVLGNMGQSNYAAANYFLNAFSHYRNEKGLSSSTVCWGPWQGEGMAGVSGAIQRNMSQLGLRPIKPDVGIKIMDDLLNHTYKELLIADVDWKAFIKERGTKEMKDFLIDIVSEDDNKEEVSMLEKLKQLTLSERSSYLMSYLQKTFGQVMGFTIDQVPDVDLSLSEQGADSLMVFAMRDELNRISNMNLDVALFFNYPSIRKLTKYLLSEVFMIENEDQEVVEIGASSEERTDEILSEIENLLK